MASNFFHQKSKTLSHLLSAVCNLILITSHKIILMLFRDEKKNFSFYVRFLIQLFILIIEIRSEKKNNFHCIFFFMGRREWTKEMIRIFFHIFPFFYQKTEGSMQWSLIKFELLLKKERKITFKKRRKKIERHESKARKKKTKKAFHPSSLRFFFSFLFILLFSSFLNNTNNEKTASSGSNENFFSHIFFIIIIINILRFILSIFLWETNLLCQKVCFHNNIKLISFFFLLSLSFHSFYCLCCCLRLTLTFNSNST